MLGTKSYVTGGDTCDFMATFVNLVSSNQGTTTKGKVAKSVWQSVACAPNRRSSSLCISSVLEKMGGAMVIIDRETRGVEMKKVTNEFQF
jgi:hypothetical protein